jgi:hypothetical protein
VRQTGEAEHQRAKNKKQIQPESKHYSSLVTSLSHCFLLKNGLNDQPDHDPTPGVAPELSRMLNRTVSWRNWLSNCQGRRRQDLSDYLRQKSPVCGVDNSDFHIRTFKSANRAARPTIPLILPFDRWGRTERRDIDAKMSPIQANCFDTMKEAAEPP